MTAGEVHDIGLMHRNRFQRGMHKGVEAGVACGERGVDPVKHELRAFLGDNQPRLRELGEVARKVGLLDPQHAFELADAEFLAQEQVQYPQTVLVGEGLEEGCGSIIHNYFAFYHYSFRKNNF